MTPTQFGWMQLISRLSRANDFSAHSPFETYAREVSEIADYVKDNPYCEVANLVGLLADGFSASRVLGLAHFRRTWSNNLVLDYLAVHPLIARPVENSPIKIRGVGTALLFFLSLIGREHGCSYIWGETTQNSCQFYERAFDLDDVGDLLYIPRQNFVSFVTELEKLWQSGGE